jgi:glycosyltransferase involved in cell wall biosynthesis
MVSISACIITFNEEKNIARCIQALKPVADEILVVDSFSTDNTAAIAAGMGVRVIKNVFKGYGEQKLFAQQQAGHDWILSVDADEVLSSELQNSLMKFKEHPQFDAYEINILANYCGTWIRHCGWYPQPKLRLWNRKKGSMNDSKVHEGIYLFDKDARTGKLQGDLLHYSYNHISDHIRKIENYTEVGARKDVERGKGCSLLKLILAPKFQFISEYIFKLGFLDGYYGYILCRNNAYASFVKYAKTREYSSLKKRGLPY